VSDNVDESQDWPLRDYSARLRPPRPTDEPAEAEQEEQPFAGEQEPEPEPAFEPPPTSSAGVEVLYDEDEEEAAAPAVQDEAAVQEEAAEPVPTLEPEPEPEQPAAEEPAADEPVAAAAAPVDEAAAEEAPVPEEAPAPEAAELQHAEGDLRIPDGASVLEGSPNGNRRTVAIVVSKFNGEISGKLLDSAMLALDEAGVARDAVLVMPVPGAFELPIAAMALAKTRRYSCVIALGCVIRGETPHFDFVAGEAASGLQLAGIETGVPVSFGLLTCDTAEQAEERVERGGWAARTALEMADAFAQLRTAVARG
jgi:6,7-dimethyl-8-ribityllumazine synthase